MDWKLIAVGLLGVLAVVTMALADELQPTQAPSHTLPAATIEIDTNSSLAFIARHEDSIIANDTHLLAAMRLLRTEGYVAQAIALGLAADQLRPLPRPVLYEMVFGYYLVGDCPPISPLLVRIASQANDALTRASRRLRIGCIRKQRTQGSWRSITRLGYDNNLAGTRDRYQLVPEAGSQLANIISDIEDDLEGLNLDLADYLFLGEAQVRGWFAETNLAGMVARRVGRQRMLADVNAFYRRTSPAGYDRKGAGVSIGWRSNRNKTLLESRLNLGSLSYHQGKRHPSVTQETLRLRQSLYYLNPKYTTAIHAHSRNSQASTSSRPTQEVGGRLVLLARANRTRQASVESESAWRIKNWQAGLRHATRQGTTDHTSTEIWGIDMGVSIAGKHGYDIHVGSRRERLRAARPWRAAPHTITHLSGRLVYYPFGDMLPIALNWQKSDSPDPHDRQTNWQLSIGYSVKSQ